MNQLMTLDSTVSMTSVELAEGINAGRAEEGDTAVLQHCHLINRLKRFDDILDGEDFRDGTYLDEHGKECAMMVLSKRACLLAVSYESHKVNLAIIDRWQELENNQKPMTHLELLKEAVKAEEAHLAKISFQSELLSQQKQVIDYKKIITAEGEEYMPVSVVAPLNVGMTFSGRRLGIFSKDMGISAIPMFASKGQIPVHAYHWTVWEAAYPEVLLPD